MMNHHSPLLNRIKKEENMNKSNHTDPKLRDRSKLLKTKKRKKSKKGKVRLNLMINRFTIRKKIYTKNKTYQYNHKILVSKRRMEKKMKSKFRTKLKNHLTAISF